MLTHPSTARNNIVAGLGEFVGTFLFLFFAFAGTQIANTPAPTVPATGFALPNTTNLIFIALAFGMSLMANVWAFYRVTGGLFNPVVALALFLVGGLGTARTIVVVISQFVAGICAAAVVSALFPGPMTVATTLGGGANKAQGLFIEMFLTAQLVFVIIMVAAEKHKSTYLAPIAIGITFFLCELIGMLTVCFALLGFSCWLLTRNSRRLFHRRLLESGSLPRASGRKPQLPRILLDLLARPSPRIAAGVWLLCDTQVS